jgi:hypothetical protein
MTSRDHQWCYKLLSRALSVEEESDLITWCEENFGRIDQQWTGYFLGRSPERCALVMIDTPADAVLFTMVWQ